MTGVQTCALPILIISWVREFDHGLGAISLPEQRATTREFRYLGMERWKLHEMVAMLPLLIQTSLLLFAIGLVLFLFNVSKPSFGVTTAIFGVGVLYYAITTTISIFVTSSPFHSPLSRTLGKVYRHIHARFCPGIYYFVSPDMDITPETPLGRLHWRIQIFLLKFRPYSEGNFEDPITARTVDEVQLSTSSSALQRIHDSVPNLQQSESILQSVWEVLSGATRHRSFIVFPFWIFDRLGDEKFFSRLPPDVLVFLKASTGWFHLPGYKQAISILARRQRDVCDSKDPWFQIMHAIIDLLPDDVPDLPVVFPDHNANVRHILRMDALLCEALPNSPELDALRNELVSSILNPIGIGQFSRLHTRRKYFWHALSRQPACMKDRLGNNLFDAFRKALREAPLRVLRAFLRDALSGNTRDCMMLQLRLFRISIEYKEPDVLIRILGEHKLREEESLTLLGMLSRFHCGGLVLLKQHVSQICLAILSHQVPSWYLGAPSTLLLDAVVSLAAISCSSNEAYQMQTLTNCDQYPWLFLNLRNTNLIRRMIEEIDDSLREELISLLFLVTHALIRQDSGPLAERYIRVIAARVDFAFCASALAAIASRMRDDGLPEITDLLVVARTEFLTSPAGGYISDFPEQFTEYGLLLKASESSDPKIAAILLLLSNSMRIKGSHLFSRTLGNVATSHDSQNGKMCHDHRVHNMFGALSLLLCPHGDTIYQIHGQFPFLISFLEASDPAISCPVLYHYMGLFGPITPPQSRVFSVALRVVFNSELPIHDLPRGWVILYRFLHEFDHYTVEWQQIFAEAFFGISRRSRLRSMTKRTLWLMMRGNKWHGTSPVPLERSEWGTPGSIKEISNIITWEYFCEENPEQRLTNGEFSGLDWMEQAWLLHLSKPDGTKVTVSTQEEDGHWSYEERCLSEQFVLQVLWNLLDAAHYHFVIPIIPRLRKFVERFDDSEHFRCKSAISERIADALGECNKFKKLHCMCPI